MRRFLLISMLFATPLIGRVNENNDVQLWITESLDAPLSSICSLRLGNEWKIGDDISKLYSFYVEGGLPCQIGKRVSTGPNYRQNWGLSGDHWKATYLPYWEVDIHQEQSGFGLSFRNRFFYVIPEGKKNSWEYRGRVRWMASWSLRNRVWKGYVSNEVFVNSLTNFEEDRLMSGVVVPLFDALKSDLYFMLRFLKGNDGWTHQNVFGTVLNFKF